MKTYTRIFKLIATFFLLTELDLMVLMQVSDALVMMQELVTTRRPSDLYLLLSDHGDKLTHANPKTHLDTPKCMQIFYDNGYANSDEAQTDIARLIANLAH